MVNMLKSNFFSDKSEASFQFLAYVIRYIMSRREMNRDWDTSISMIIHNHPGNSGPSGFHENSKDGDKYSAKFLPKAQHFVYLPGSGELILYDQKTIYEAKKWEEVFSTLK